VPRRSGRRFPGGGPRGGTIGVALFLALLATAAVAEEWFDAYQRGLAALRQKNAPRAVELFERAIRLRADPGASLLTYGTNRLDEYYPYLRLAEAHLLAGNTEAARDALKRSDARGREPAAERARIAGEIEALEGSRRAAATPPSTVAPVPPVTATAAPPPPTLSVAPGPAVAPPAAAPSGETTGTLDLRTDPAGASALVAGRFVGTTPVRVALAAGNYQITIRKEGTADQTFPVRISAGQPTVETRALVLTASPSVPPIATPEVAALVVLSDPPGATVYLDDEPLGATDPGSGRLVKSGARPGSHRIRLSAEGRPDVSYDVVVAPAGPTMLHASLPASARPSAFSALGGLAALLALAGVGLLLLQRRKKQAAGELPGGTVALPGSPGASGRSITLEAPRAANPTPARAPTEVPASTLDASVGGLEGLLETRAIPKGKPSGVGERFGEYLLLEPLGKGGMATVFKAQRNQEVVALKRPLPAFLEDQEFLERFLREAEIGRTLHHPNIIRIFERGHVDGVPYFTMELVRGETLQEHVKRTGPLGNKPAARVISQVAEALDYAHLKGIIHRDLKPSNIMILEDGSVKVMDYGIARARRFEGLTVTGAFLGTPDYVAPETAEGKPTDARSDLYSLGVVFYEILTGKKPFIADTPFATLRKHVSEPPTPPSVVVPNVSLRVEAIILRLLAKDPADRFPGAEELLIELREFLNRVA
jgi:hypothetical protein